MTKYFLLKTRIRIALRSSVRFSGNERRLFFHRSTSTQMRKISFSIENKSRQSIFLVVVSISNDSSLSFVWLVGFLIENGFDQNKIIYFIEKFILFVLIRIKNETIFPHRHPIPMLSDSSSKITSNDLPTICNQSVSFFFNINTFDRTVIKL